jgi:hypothetical protein
VIGGRHGDLENIRLKFISEKLPIEAHETKATTASKIDRVEQRLVGQFHAGKVYLPRKLPRVYRHDGKSYDFVQEYLLEYRQFPFSEHDDILDCHSQLFDGSYLEKGTKKIEASKDDEFEWWRNQAINAKKPNRKRYIFGSHKYHSIPFTEAFK